MIASSIGFKTQSTDPRHRGQPRRISPYRARLLATVPKVLFRCSCVLRLPTPTASAVYCCSWHFGSRHNGVIYFAFADGSVRGIQNTGDMNRGQMFQMMLNLGGINDGNVVEGP